MASDPEKSAVTDLLLAWNSGEREALDQLLPLIAGELRKLASHYLRGERDGHTLQPTALVNELYLRLIDRQQVSWQGRAHFFAFAATTMRRILVDHARAKLTGKRGGERDRITLVDDLALVSEVDIDLLALDESLDDLDRMDSRLRKVVELRFFAGLTIDEVAEVLDIGPATVNRDWRAAKAFLSHRLTQ